MGFNYAKEKRKFLREWKLLRTEYEAAGMPEETIKELFAYDWDWFCSRRRFAAHSQALPIESIDDDDEESQSTLVNKFESMRTEFDESAFDGRFAWVDTIEDKALVDKLRRLSQEDLELLTLLAIDGYSQSELERCGYQKQYKISRRFDKIKIFLEKSK